MGIDPDRPQLKDIYARFDVDYDAHKPCEICARATGKESMCPEGRRAYLRMLEGIEELKRLEDEAGQSEIIKAGRQRQP